MSEEGVKSAEEKAAEARRGPTRAGQNRGPMGMAPARSRRTSARTPSG